MAKYARIIAPHRNNEPIAVHAPVKFILQQTAIIQGVFLRSATFYRG